MYRRYMPENAPAKQTNSQTNKNFRKGTQRISNNKNPQPKRNPVLSFIPSGLYNPETGKIFGFLSADDLLLIALILILIDSNDDRNDNTFLIYALIYILISDYTDLPF